MAKSRSRTGRVDDRTGLVRWTEDTLTSLRETITTSRSDGWLNVLTGLGDAARDKRSGAGLVNSPRLSQQREFLDELYHGDDLAGRIVDLLPQEMFREWIDFTMGGGDGGSDTETAALVLQELDALGAQEAFDTGKAWGRLFGGSLTLLGVDDGQEMDKPLNFDSIKSLDWLTTLDRFDVDVNSVYEDPLEEKYGQPETYRIITASGAKGADKIGTIIHESRTIRWDGARTSRHKRRQNNGWCDSIFERYIYLIRDFQGATDGIMHLLTDFSQAVFKIKDLSKALAADADNLVIKRLKLLDIGRSMVRAIPLDADSEDFDRKGATVTGMSDLYDRMMMKVSAATGYPVTLLFGRSPAGMNATGESDIKMFYDFVRSRQESEARPRLEYLLRVILNAAEGPTGGVEPESWNFEWCPLFQETAKERADTRKSVAETDKIYTELGVTTANDIAKSRFGGDTYSPETMIDWEERETPSEMEIEQENKSEAPNYGVQEEGRVDSMCSSCAFASGATCTRFGFVTDRGFSCDDWMKTEEIVSITADAPKKKRKRRPRGRNC